MNGTEHRQPRYHATKNTTTFTARRRDFRCSRSGTELCRRRERGQPDPIGGEPADTNLERELGVALFTRFNRRIELTVAGARFLEAAGRAIDLIEQESSLLRPQQRRGVLRLSTLQSLTSTWLLPRLVAFRQQRPDIDIQIETSAELADLASFDAAIQQTTTRSRRTLFFHQLRRT